MLLQDFHTKQDYARQLRYARSKFRRISSLDLIPEYPSQEESSDETVMAAGHSTSKSNGIPRNSASNNNENKMNLKAASSLRRNMLLFWPNLLLNIIYFILRSIICLPLSIAAPSFWLCALLWIFWKIIRIPMGCIKWLYLNTETTATAVSLPASQALKKTNPEDYFSSNQLNVNVNVKSMQTGQMPSRRTVLISCGSTVQTLHLARNFHLSGARVIVFEFDGLFGLARFSSAVDKFYIVPRPTPQNVNNYIVALCHIARKEQVSIYVPVCATSPAYYDSLVKPHLELLGCATFITTAQDTLVLDDCLQFYQRCASQHINLPPFMNVTSLRELWELYDGNFLQHYRNIFVAVGMQGILERFKYILPSDKRDLKFPHEISDQQQWLVVRDVPGKHYITCTTVKNSQVVANVSCRVDHETKNLIPIATSKSLLTKSNAIETNDSALIEHWLKVFFAKVRFQRPINCHISFRLVKCQNTNEFLPLGVRLGVSLPYICYNRSHALKFYQQQTVKCNHATSCTSTSMNSNRCVQDSNAASMESCNQSSTVSLKSSLISQLGMETKSTNANGNGNGNANVNVNANALDKRVALFTYWDPLPYCAYYHFQLPLESVKSFIQRKRPKSNDTNTLAQHKTTTHIPTTQTIMH